MLNEKVEIARDRLQELLFFASFAGQIVNENDTGDQHPFDWGAHRQNPEKQPEAWVANTLLPFLRTLSYRLPELQKMMEEFLDGYKEAGELLGLSDHPRHK